MTLYLQRPYLENGYTLKRQHGTASSQVRNQRPTASLIASLPSGTEVASRWHDESLRFRNTSSGESTHELESRAVAHHEYGSYSAAMAFSPGGRLSGLPTAEWRFQDNSIENNSSEPPTERGKVTEGRVREIAILPQC